MNSFHHNWTFSDMTWVRRSYKQSLIKSAWSWLKIVIDFWRRLWYFERKFALETVGKKQFYIVWFSDVKINNGRSWSSDAISKHVGTFTMCLTADKTQKDVAWTKNTNHIQQILLSDWWAGENEHASSRMHYSKYGGQGNVLSYVCTSIIIDTRIPSKRFKKIDKTE